MYLSTFAKYAISNEFKSPSARLNKSNISGVATGRRNQGPRLGGVRPVALLPDIFLLTLPTAPSSYSMEL